jgi:uncharacterized protein
MPHEPITERAELERLLRETRYGVLATVGPDGQPYTTPLNHFYDHGKLYFHCALRGRKLDNLAANPRVCYTAFEAGRLKSGERACDCAQRYASVICTGTARLIADAAVKADILTRLTEHFAGRSYTPPPEVRINGTAVVEITITEMTGKRNVDQLTRETGP